MFHSHTLPFFVATATVKVSMLWWQIVPLPFRKSTQKSAKNELAHSIQPTIIRTVNRTENKTAPANLPCSLAGTGTTVLFRSNRHFLPSKANFVEARSLEPRMLAYAKNATQMRRGAFSGSFLASFAPLLRSKVADIILFLIKYQERMLDRFSKIQTL